MRTQLCVGEGALARCFTVCWLLLQQHCIIQDVPVLKLLIATDNQIGCICMPSHAYAFPKACMCACLCHSVSLWCKLVAGLLQAWAPFQGVGCGACYRPVAARVFCARHGSCVETEVLIIGLLLCTSLSSVYCLDCRCRANYV